MKKFAVVPRIFLTETLPDLIPPKEWQRAIKEYEAVGDRDFIAGF